MKNLPTEPGTPEPVVLDAHHVIEQVRDEAMFLIDRQGLIASWNEGVRQILGWGPDEWIGQPVQVAFTPQDVAAGVPQAELQRAADTGRADDDRWMRRKNGEHFFALGNVTRMADEQGALLGYFKVLRDYTGPKQAEQALERLVASESQSREWAENQSAALTAAIEAIADGVFIGDTEGLRRCNAAALDMLGATEVGDFQLDPAALVQRFRLRREREGPLLDGADVPFWSALPGQTQVLELWATHSLTGADLFLRSASAPIASNGRVLGAVAVLTDLGERLQLRERGHALSRVQTVLQERDAELRAVVDGVRDYAIFTLDIEGRISSWHTGAELLKGYTAAEAIGMPFAQLFVEEDRASGRPAMEMDIAARTGEYKGDGLRVRKDGSTFDAAVVLTALRGDKGELLGFLKLTQDISQRRAQEREREDMLQAAHAARLEAEAARVQAEAARVQAESARAEAERTSHSKGEFLATISHELRTPLSAILGWAHVLDRGVFDPETVKHGLTAIARNARIQVQLIEDLLDMNRIESGQLRLDLQRIELGGVVAAAIDSALPSAHAKGIVLRTVFGPAGGAVMGDAARLQQVVGNLLSNAIKFTPEGGQISVTLAVANGQAQIAVADTGQGIEPDFVGRMFDRFQQQDATITRRHGGLGLGLSIVRHLMQLHGGSVRAYSAGSGQGATFTVCLPIAGAAAASAGVAASAAACAAPSAMPSTVTSPAPASSPAPVVDATAHALDGVAVLLVDDEPDVRTVTARLLQDAGARVLTAASADEAMALLHSDLRNDLRQHRPAVLLSDIGMPQADGYELMRRVRALPPDEGGGIPAAAFTAYTRPEDRARAIEAGYQMHLAKPVPPTALVAAIAALTGR